MMGAETAIWARMSELNDLDRTALRLAWAKAFDRAPPHHISMMFMRKALIRYEQCRRFGGLSPTLKRALKASANGRASLGVSSAIIVNPGTQLVREWNGRRYIVEVNKDGFMLGDEHFKSLSAIALHITGTKWSGPRFFGLTGRAGVTP